MLMRPRRLRANAMIRNLVAETSLSLGQLIQPYFLAENDKAEEPIEGFSNVSRWGIDRLSARLERDMENGVRSFLLFGGTTDKNAKATKATSESSVVPRALKAIRKRFGTEIFLSTDVCLCPYTSHGHCGLKEKDEVLNDDSLKVLAKMALVHAECGADMVAPSDMMDGRILAIREALDGAGLTNVGILAYTAKYASSYYGPFREALSSSPEPGSDRSTYQMDFRNRKEALKELRLDESEGADIVMVKPALAYLDVISDFAAHTNLPIAAYSVSAEYQMVKLLAEKGFADEKKLALENLTAIRRAGADIIITYFATQCAEEKWIRP